MGFGVDGQISALSDACTDSMHDAAAYGPLYEIERIFRCLQHAEDLESESFDFYKNHIRSYLLNTCAADCERVNPNLADVIRRVAETLAPTTVDELLSELETLNAKAHRQVGEAVGIWGGPTAIRRWQHCPIASVKFDFAPAGPTGCSFRDNEITFHIGVRENAARTFFNLELYLFHEYLSHSLSAWTDTLLTEGLLVTAALTLVSYVADHPVRQRFARLAWDSRPDGPTKRRNGEAEAWAEWLIRWGGVGALRYLLDWSATAPDGLNPVRLKRLGFVYNRAAHLKIHLAFEGPYPGVQVLHDRLERIADEMLPGSPSHVPLKTP